MKHGKTNYKALKPFFEVVDRNEGYAKFISGGYMPLSIDRLYDIPGHGTVYSMAHNGIQNGDLMADPDMELLVDDTRGAITPMTYQNDYMGIYQKVFEGSLSRFRPRLMIQLDQFLYEWRRNLEMQGFTPDRIEATEILHA